MIANLDFVRERNVSAVYQCIVNSGAISRTQVARQCNLAAGSVTRITKQLIQEGLVSEVEQQHSERGRKAVSLAPREGALQVLAARAGRTHLHIGLCDLSGTPLAQKNTPLSALDQHDYTQQVISLLTDFLGQHSDRFNRIAGVGITTPGLVDSAKGIIHFMPHLQVNDFHLADQVSEAQGFPCFLGNDAAAMALAEYHFGASKGHKNSLFVRVHNGVGMGMIFDGQLYQGNSLAVGEIGHIQINPVGKRCYCGNFGCLETEVSNLAIEQMCQERLEAGIASIIPNRPSILQICKAAEEGDQLASTLLEQAAIRLGKVIALSVNLLRPECVILSGEMFGASSTVYPAIQHSLSTQTVPVSGQQFATELYHSKLEHYPWYGGFALVHRQLLERGLLMKLLTPHAGSKEPV